ncbi:MAG: ATP-binding protein [Bacteroidota bacterium]
MRIPGFRFSLSQKILLGIVPVFMLFLAAGVMVQNHFQDQAMQKEAQMAAYTYADIVKESLVSMMLNNLAVDSTFIGRVNTLPEIDTLRIFVNNLKLRTELLTHARIARLAAKYKSLLPEDDLDRQVLATGQPAFRREGNKVRGVIPFNASTVCQRCHAVPVGYTLGATDLIISMEAVERAAEGNWKRSILIFFVIVGTVMGIATVLFRQLVSHPVERLVAATRAIGEGDLDYKIPLSPSRGMPPDELHVLALRFDGMRSSLKEKIEQLDQLNRSLAEQNVQMENTLRQLRATQEELVRSERLAITGKLMAQLSHELNNPIHNIQSLLQSSVKHRSSHERSQDLLEVALEEVERLARLTRQMLDFFRSSVVEIGREPITIGLLLGEVAKMYEPSLADESIRIVVAAAPSLPTVQGSRDRFKQVIINLVANARDAIHAARTQQAEHAAGTITLAAGEHNGGVRVSVHDDGIGIPKPHLDKIFDAFFTTKQEVSGVGLGLFVSYGIIQQHNGTIVVESEEGKGTTFHIDLPAGDHDNPAS